VRASAATVPGAAAAMTVAGETVSAALHSPAKSSVSAVAVWLLHVSVAVQCAKYASNASL